MGIDTHVTSRAWQALAFPVWNMLLGFRVTVLFRHTKVNHEYRIAIFRSWTSDQKIVGLNIAVDQISFMYSLHTRDLRTAHEIGF